MVTSIQQPAGAQLTPDHPLFTRTTWETSEMNCGPPEKKERNASSLLV